MLDTEELDMVSVCTYTVDPDGHDLHTEITLYCIQKGIRAVWCEKPAVASMSAAEAMLAAAEANGTLLVINHNRRWQNVQRRLQARPTTTHPTQGPAARPRPLASPGQPHFALDVVLGCRRRWLTVCSVTSPPLRSSGPPAGWVSSART